MTIAIQTQLTVEEFLKLPETKPAQEFIDGEITQKPMPQGGHSLLQSKICSIVNQITETTKIAYAFPELRCTFGGESIIPDIAVFRWDRIPLQSSGRVANRFEIHPDWAIEILSPDQSSAKVLSKLLHCSQHGTELGWLIYPEEDTILVVLPGQKVELLIDDSPLPILDRIPLELTVKEVFGWLTFGES
jgi:Uma2 family endonuclease